MHGLADRSAVPASVELELPPARLDPTVESTAYYVIAESVSNVHKHAEARSVSIGAVTLPNHLRLAIADDGVGGASVRPGSGLEGLRDRVEATGGTFRISSRPGVGTEVTAILPLRPTRL